MLGVAPVDERGERRFNQVVHWGYGAAWGAARGLLGGLGVHGASAALAHLAVVWGSEQVVLPATGAGDPATKWAPRGVAIDLWHHAVYAAGTSVAYGWLDHRS